MDLKIGLFRKDIKINLKLTKFEFGGEYQRQDGFNLKVLDKISESRKFIEVLERMGVKFFSHLLRYNEFATEIIEGKVVDKRGRSK